MVPESWTTNARPRPPPLVVCGNSNEKLVEKEAAAYPNDLEVTAAAAVFGFPAGAVPGVDSAGIPLVQVNATGAETQSGVAPPEVPALVDELRSLDLQVRGLMTIGAMGDLERSRAEFRSIRALADRLELPECSMGMSGDLEAALEEGSTMIRVGTTIFGPRPVG